jgi:branched-chain amino acid transport system permease protein
MNRSYKFIFLLFSVTILIFLPLILSPNFINALIKMMIASLFALAFALAMGQAGMLSFGHAAYYGLGAFAALHLMRAVEMKLVIFPTPLIPIAGAAAGLFSGLVFGWMATKRTGTYFAMLTFALAELLATLATTWTSAFGGESGISTMRGASWGFTFGTDLEVYYITLAWMVISTWCLWAFTKTPIGRLALALRDNENRAKFLGFNTHITRTIIFSVSCMFAGIAGALLAIANETTNYIIFSANVSSNVVLQTFIGGAGTFFGPAIGAAAMTFFARAMSDLTRSWLLYQGLLFVLVMLFLPEGLGGLVSLHARKLQPGGWRKLIIPYLFCCFVSILLIGGVVFVVESLHAILADSYSAKRQLTGGVWPSYQLAGQMFDPISITTWLIPVILLSTGATLLIFARRITALAWAEATHEASLLKYSPVNLKDTKAASS